MRRYYLLDHKSLFLFGFVFYLVVPFVAGHNHWFTGFPGVELYQQMFSLIPDRQLLIYAAVAAGWFISFYAGHLAFKIFRPQKRSLQLFPQTLSSWGISYIALGLFFVLILFAFLGRHSLFGGYGSYDVAARGKMSTLLVLYNAFLIFQLLSRQRKSPLLIIGTLLTAFLLLTMGGRMYVFQTFFLYAIYKTSFSPRPWRWGKILGFTVAGFFLGAFFGIWRLKSGFSFSKATYSFFAEPIFTWFSTGSYLISNDVPLFSIPLNHLTSFYNLVPNTIISLRPFIVSTYSMVKNYQSPLGADSIWSTVVINFGSLGSCVFLFLTGFLLHFLRHRSERSRFSAAYYILFCSMLPFQFFRDGFYIQHKQLLINFLFMPALIFAGMKGIFFLQKKALSLPAATFSGSQVPVTDRGS